MERLSVSREIDVNSSTEVGKLLLVDLKDELKALTESRANELGKNIVVSVENPKISLEELENSTIISLSGNFLFE